MQFGKGLSKIRLKYFPDQRRRGEWVHMRKQKGGGEGCAPALSLKYSTLGANSGL